MMCACARAREQACMHVHVCVFMCICMHVYVHKLICSWVCLYMHAFSGPCHLRTPDGMSK
jgi:hypothetical protein